MDQVVDKLSREERDVWSFPPLLHMRCTSLHVYTPPRLGFWTLLNSLIRVRNKGGTLLWVWPVHPQESLCSPGAPAYSSPWQPAGCPQRHHQSLEESPGLCVCVSLPALQLVAWPEKGVSEFALVLPSFPTLSPLQHPFQADRLFGHFVFKQESHFDLLNRACLAVSGDWWTIRG